MYSVRGYEYLNSACSSSPRLWQCDIIAQPISYWNYWPMIPTSFYWQKVEIRQPKLRYELYMGIIIQIWFKTEHSLNMAKQCLNLFLHYVSKYAVYR